MRVLILAGRMLATPWSAGALVLHVARTLKQRGHDVTLVAHDLDDEECFAGIGTVHAMRRYSTGLGDFTPGFARFARAQARRVEHDVSLSFSRDVSGDVWLPLEADAESWLAARKVERGVLGIAPMLYRHWGVVPALVSQALRRLPATVAPAGPRCVLAVGPTAAGEAARNLAPTGLDQRVTTLAYPVMQAAMGEDALVRARRAFRALLNIDEQRRVFLVASTGDAGRALVPVYQGLGEVVQREGTGAPVLVVLCRDPVTQHGHAVHEQVTANVRMIGPTGRMGMAIAGSDVVLLARKAQGGMFESGATGRLAADAMALGRPLISVSGAPGYDLCRRGLPDGAMPGQVLDIGTPDAWARAMRRMLEPMAFADASRAARALGDVMRGDEFADELERALTHR